MFRRSQRLREKEVRVVFHLIGEVTELGRDTLEWRLHLMQRLLPLIDGRVGFIGEHYINPANPVDTRVVGTIDCGWASGEQELFYDYLNSGGMARDPFHTVTPRLLFRSYTRRRRDLVDDKVFAGVEAASAQINGNRISINTRTALTGFNQLSLHPRTTRRTTR